MPSAEEEIWRYSRIGDLDLDQFTPQPDRAEIDVPAPVELIVDGELDNVDDPDVFDELVEAFGRCSASRPERRSPKPSSATTTSPPTAPPCCPVW